jgi:hypothetical protein
LISFDLECGSLLPLLGIIKSQGASKLAHSMEDCGMIRGNENYTFFDLSFVQQRRFLPDGGECAAGP